MLAMHKAAAAPRARLCSRCCAAPLPPLRAGAVIARAELVSGVLTPACGQLLRTLATDRARTAVERYTQQREAWPEVTFTLRRRAALGDVYKILGPAAELGRWAPDLAPPMLWADGDVWSTRARLPPGEHRFKAALRSADGVVTWEAGPDRVVTVPTGAARLTVALDVAMPWELSGAAEAVVERAPAHMAA